MQAAGDEAMRTMTVKKTMIRPAENAGGKKHAGRSGRNVRAERREGSGRSSWKISTAGINIHLHFMKLSASEEEKTAACMKSIFRWQGDGRVSKIHCVIIHRGDKLYLKDEGSRNGTYLNGERLDGPVVIQRDDIIGVGETRFEVQRILRESE